jgi:hypothetical protein
MNQNDKEHFSRLTKQVWDFADLVLKNRLGWLSGFVRLTECTSAANASRRQLMLLPDTPSMSM